MQTCGTKSGSAVYAIRPLPMYADARVTGAPVPIGPPWHMLAGRSCGIRCVAFGAHTSWKLAVGPAADVATLTTPVSRMIVVADAVSWNPITGSIPARLPSFALPK